MAGRRISSREKPLVTWPAVARAVHHDPAATGSCATCGNCRPHLLDTPEAEVVRTILSGIASSGERYGRRRIVAMLTGETEALPPGLASASQAGALRAEDVLPDQHAAFVHVDERLMVGVVGEQDRSQREMPDGRGERRAP